VPLAPAPSAYVAPPRTALSPEHALLQNFVGRFVAKTRYFATGSEPVEAVAEVTGFSILGGLYVEMHFSRPEHFSGRAIFGFSTQRQLYTSVWMDTLSGTPLLEAGEVTGSPNTLELRSVDSPISAVEPNRMLRTVYEFRGSVIQATVLATVQGAGGPSDRRETRVMDVLYTRL